MNKILHGILLNFKLDLRNKNILLVYYVVPLIFFTFMSGIFTSIDPNAYKTLIPSMTIFAITMGAIIGFPNPLVEFFNSDIKKMYVVGNIPLWIELINNFISAFIHLFIVSTLIFFVAPITFKATVPLNLSNYFLSLALLIISSLSIGLVLGLFIKSISKLTMISQIVFLPSIMLSGIMFPTEMLPSFLEKLGSILPSTIAFKSMCSSSFSMNLLLLILITIICIVISIFRLKKLKTD
ncbi:ABC transporter permease [Clostridium sp. B9]|uniref:ABC transporter permease n=1 Tax=Clostridium sp. B9 TaxID=3423224 RepID=UPI003D2EB5AB